MPSYSMFVALDLFMHASSGVVTNAPLLPFSGALALFPQSPRLVPVDILP